MKPIVIIVAGLLLAGCQEPGARTAEEQANVQVVENLVDGFNRRDGFGAWLRTIWHEDGQHTGYVSWRTDVDSPSLEEMISNIERNHELSPKREMRVKRILAEGNLVVLEAEVLGEQREFEDLGDSKAIFFYEFRDGRLLNSTAYELTLRKEAHLPPER